MNNHELDQLLKAVRVLEAPPEFQAELGRRVGMAIRRRQPTRPRSGEEPRAFDFRDWVLGGAVVAVVLLIAFLLGPSRLATESTVAYRRAEKCIREIETLFPNQVRSVVFDANGSRMVLSEKADVPDSVPVYLKICGPNGCQEIITFSGQQVRVNGQMCDVLIDSAGDIMVVGQNLIWSSGTPEQTAKDYRIKARSLATPS